MPNISTAYSLDIDLTNVDGNHISDRDKQLFERQRRENESSSSLSVEELLKEIDRQRHVVKI